MDGFQKFFAGKNRIALSTYKLTRIISLVENFFAHLSFADVDAFHRGAGAAAEAFAPFGADASFLLFRVCAN